MDKSFVIEFLGCKVNNYETECIGNLLIEKGYHFFDKNNDLFPTVILINTCAVTKTSEIKDKKVIKRYRKEYPDSIMVVMGCFSQFAYQEISEKLNADIVLGTSRRSEIPALIEKYIGNHMKIVLHDENNDIKKYEPLNLMDSLTTTRAYLKIQDGCNNFCTYCLIPYIRGRSRSRDKNDILAEIKRLISLGYKEIVLTGIDMGSYGEDKKEDNYFFSDLLEDILKNNPDLYRLRISSIEESQLDDKFFELLKKYPNLANHLHIPLQSGSATVLKRMNRKYDLANFKEKIKIIRNIRPDIAITTDVISGFVGETDEEFLETYNFCKEIKFSKIHCFPYSKREGTFASKMDGDLSNEIKKNRNLQLLSLSNQLEKEYALKFKGQEIEFLMEDYDPKKKIWRGHSSNYLEAFISSNNDLQDKVIKVKF